VNWKLAIIAGLSLAIANPVTAEKPSPPHMSAMTFAKTKASRSIIILVPQNGLEADYALSHLAQEDPLVRYGFGLSGLLVQGIGTSNNRKKAEKRRWFRSVRPRRVFSSTN